ncbi:MAG: AEC family transporter [Elusimicrobia bacterium]|nr:AEC family transporter [Elusimicrobiota bacterium]
MNEAWVVLLKTASMFLVIGLGWLARRRGLVDAAAATAIGRLTVDVAFPALVVTQLLKTVDPAALRHEWAVPLMGAFTLCLAGGVGLALRPFFSDRSGAPTFVFLVAIPNWIFLPLPIAEALFGGDGVRQVLLFNVGAQAILWTLGVWTLSGPGPARSDWKPLLLNPGILSTACGVALALCFPALRSFDSPGLRALWAAPLQGLAMAGSLTIPLSLLVTGMQMSGLEPGAKAPELRPLAGVLLGRLLAAPLASVAVLRLLAAAGWMPSPTAGRVALLIAAMPVAVSCTVFAERYSGDAALSARAIFHTTLWSVLTVPVFCWLF